MKNKLLLFLTILLMELTTSQQTTAQNFAPYAGSNYSGTNGMILNPASGADSRQFIYLNAFGQGLSFRNDYMYYSSTTPIMTYIKSQDPNWENYFIVNNNGKDHNFDFSSDSRGPALMVSWNEKNTVALTTRMRTMFSVYDVAEPLITTLRNGWKEGQLNLYNGTPDDRFKLNVNMYSEFALSYARVVYDKKQHFLKAGASIKRERGLFIFNYTNRQLDFRFAGHDSVVAFQTDGTVTYTSENYFGIDSLKNAANIDPKQTIKKWFFGSEKLGGGLGFDIGAQYEWRPKRRYFYTMDCQKHRNPEVNKYKLKLGFSINDIGHITYNNKNVKTFDVKNGKAYTSVVDTVFWGHSDTLKIHNSNDIVSSLNSIIGGIDPKSTPFKAHLPTVLVLQADYLVRNHVYVNMTYIQSLRRKYSDGSRFGSTLTITPRYEHRWFEAAMPVVIHPAFKYAEVGFGARLGPVFAGTDNIGGILGIGKIRGADFYIGACIDIAKHMKRDKDKDKVSDKLDKCPSEKGTCLFEGCPDRDNDSIPDNLDKCPDKPGTIKLQGCPDADKDGITDSLDECPDVAGLKATKGCPDKDKDGVADKDDKCPDKAGDKKTFGCPDTDRDGLTDDIDKCPAEPGSKELEGCPDTDKDGIADNVDRCPTKAGSKELNGCPDKDKDGIADIDDQCPNQKGTEENHGCPEKKIPEAEQALVSMAVQNLLFENNRSVIDERSYASLDSVAQLMLSHRKYKLKLSGYTDNVGNEAKNIQLSEDRAKAVKLYLTVKGVAENRITAAGYGPANPIADNKTPEGRKLNRRVEFEIVR